MTKIKIRHLFPGLFFSITLFIFAPLELFMINSGEFWFSLSDILPVLIVAVIACTLLLTLLLWLLPSKVSSFVELMIYAITLLLYVQGNYLVIDYGTLNGEQIDWSRYSGRMIVNGAIWITVIVLMIILFVKFKSKLPGIMKTVACIVLVTQVVTLAVIGLTGKNANREYYKRYLSTKNEYTVSSNSNTIVILLDCFDAQLFMNMYESDPAMIEETFKDFTFYHNTVGGATRTRFAIPFLFSGITNTKEQSYQDYLKEVSQESVFFQELRSGNYDTGIYTSNMFIDMSQEVAVDNIVTGKSKVSSPIGLTRDFMKLVLFRYVPNMFSRYFWMYSGDFNKWKETGDFGEYPFNDVLFYNTLVETGLSCETEQSCFRFYHLNGAHAPYTMNDKCESISYTEGNELLQAKGCIRILKEYIKQLKALNAYDNSTIIIMSDHGYSQYSVVEQNPLFIVKTRNSDKEFDISEIPLWYKSIPSLFKQSIRNEPIDMEDYAIEGSRLFYNCLDKGSEIIITEYEIPDTAFDNESIRKTGVVFHGEEQDHSEFYDLGKPVYFDFRDEARPYIIDGFSQNTQLWTWTNKEASELIFKVGNVTDDLQMIISYHTFYDKQRVRVLVSGEEVDYFVATGEETKIINIPNKLIRDGELKVTLELPDAISPKSLGQSEDTSAYALGIKSIVIDKR